MTARLEDEVRSSLHAQAATVEVPPAPRYLPSPRPGRGRSRSVTILLVAAVVILTAAIPTGLTFFQSQTPKTAEPTTLEQPRSQLGHGPLPKLAYLDDQQVIIDGEGVGSVTPGAVLSSAIAVDGRLVTLIYEPSSSAVSNLGDDGALTPLSRNALSRPVLDQSATRAVWVTAADQGVIVVLALIDSTGAKIHDRQPIAEADPSQAYAVGVDQFGRVFVSDDAHTWVWDSEEGREGSEPEPPNSSTHLWKVSGIEGQSPVQVTANELLIRSQDPDAAGRYEFSWGTVPRQGEPYRENDALTTADAWFARAGDLVTQEPDGQLRSNALEVSTEPDATGEVWAQSALTGASTDWGLPQDFVAQHLTDEADGHVLVDGTLGDGTRAWLRCAAPGDCEIATELSAQARTPGQWE